jgi:hypothetical protein
VACGSSRPVASHAATANHAAAASGGEAGTPSGDEAATPGDGEPAAPRPPAIPPGTTCVPPIPEESIRELGIGRVGTTPVVCVTDRRFGPAACWDLDVKTGAVTSRATAPLPGRAFAIDAKLGCYQGLCWPTTRPRPDTPDNGAVLIAYHPDGTRAAILAHAQIAIFDLATKKATSTFPLNKAPDIVGENEIGNMPNDLWFAGDTVFVRGDDAGPYSTVFRYTTDGKPRGNTGNIYNGTATLADDRHLALNEDGLATLTLLDATGGRRIQRSLGSLPKGCTTDAFATWDDDELSAGGACGAFIKAKLVPFQQLHIIAIGTRFVALDPGTRTLYDVDGKSLSPKPIAKLATCK